MVYFSSVVHSISLSWKASSISRKATTDRRLLAYAVNYVALSIRAPHSKEVRSLVHSSPCFSHNSIYLGIRSDCWQWSFPLVAISEYSNRIFSSLMILIGVNLLRCDCYGWSAFRHVFSPHLLCDDCYGATLSGMYSTATHEVNWTVSYTATHRVKLDPPPRLWLWW